MIEAWVFELLYGLGRFFMNPLLYLLFLFTYILGYRRTKRERKDFSIRIHSSSTEWSEFAWSGFAVGLCISGVMIGLGVVIPVGFAILMSLLAIVFLLTLQPRWLSPAFIVGLSLIISLFLPEIKSNQPFILQIETELANAPMIVFAILLSLLLLAEGFLILKKGFSQTSPKLKRSKRGKQIGIHEVKKMWMVPVLLLIPGDAITSVFEWWPVIKTPYETFSLLCIPFGIGFQQQIQASLPKVAIQLTGRKVFILALIVTGLAVGSYWLPILAIVSAVVAIIGREFINVKQRMVDENSISFFASRESGMVILGVVPHSPAQKMSLMVGEIITKVNGNQVLSEKEFYEALIVNRALCKLEVLDYNGEVRFVQRALYDGEHHELGLLFVHDDKQWAIEAV